MERKIQTQRLRTGRPLPLHAGFVMGPDSPKPRALRTGAGNQNRKCGLRIGEHKRMMRHEAHEAQLKNPLERDKQGANTMISQIGAVVAQISPDADQIPGSEQLTKVIGGMMGWGLLLAGAALIISAVIWAFGANSQNSQQATAGKRGVLIAVGAAVIIGAGQVFIQWAFDLGQQVS